MEHSLEKMRRISQLHRELADLFPVGTGERRDNLRAAQWWKEEAKKVDGKDE